MAVYTSINYQQPVNSDLVNEHTSEVIAPGVYRGMYIRSHGENSRCLDVRNVAEGDGDLGELSLENIGLAFMPQGMKVFLSAPQFYTEEDPILSKLIVEPAGERDRIDLVCLQYEYKKVVPSANKPSYVIIKGREALPGKLPKAPDVYSAEELDPEHGRTRDKFRRIRIPMAHIHVRVGTEFVTDADISNIRRSMNTNDVLKYMDSIFYSIYGNCRFEGWLLKRDGEEYNIIVTPGTGMIDGRLHSTKMDAIVQDIKPQIVLMEEQNPSTNMSLNVQLPYPSALKFEITSNSEETIPEGASFLVSGIWIDGEQQLEETREFRLQEEIRQGETSKIIIDKAVSVSEAGINMEGIVEGGINPEDINVTVYNMPVAYIIAIAQPSNVPIFRDEYDPRYILDLPSTEMMLGWVEVDEGQFIIHINTDINNERMHWSLATIRDLDPMFRRSRYGYGYGEQEEPEPNIPDHPDHPDQPDIKEHHVLNVWVNDDNMVRSVEGLGEGVYDVGTDVIVTLIAEDGYHFVEWEDGNTDNPRTFTIGHEDIYITAIFAEDEAQAEYYDANGRGYNIVDEKVQYLGDENLYPIQMDAIKGRFVTVNTDSEKDYRLLDTYTAGDPAKLQLDETIYKFEGTTQRTYYKLYRTLGTDVPVYCVLCTSSGEPADSPDGNIYRPVYMDVTGRYYVPPSAYYMSYASMDSRGIQLNCNPVPESDRNKYVHRDALGRPYVVNSDGTLAYYYDESDSTAWNISADSSGRLIGMAGQDGDVRWLEPSEPDYTASSDVKHIRRNVDLGPEGTFYTLSNGTLKYSVDGRIYTPIDVGLHRSNYTYNEGALLVTTFGYYSYEASAVTGLFDRAGRCYISNGDGTISYVDEYTSNVSSIKYLIQTDENGERYVQTQGAPSSGSDTYLAGTGEDAVSEVRYLDPPKSSDSIDDSYPYYYHVVNTNLDAYAKFEWEGNTLKGVHLLNFSKSNGVRYNMQVDDRLWYVVDWGRGFMNYYNIGEITIAYIGDSPWTSEDVVDPYADHTSTFQGSYSHTII